MKAHTEEAFERLIEAHLVDHGGYRRGGTADWDARSALIESDLLRYVRDTQPKVWEKQEKIHGDGLGRTLVAAFDKATVDHGLLHVLRRGFKFYGDMVRVVTFRPAHGKNPDVERAYAANRLAVVRQLHHDPKKPGDALDLVLIVNGIPLVTAELKNTLTGQGVEHAVGQYRADRSAETPIFHFNRRALVHFAVGHDRVRMTTRLAGAKTTFLPFDRGDGVASGNRRVEGRHRTCYLWETIWQRDSLLDIVAHFLHLERKKGKADVMIFPRFHQLRCVRKLVGTARENGPGTNYLVQHSAGSGKSKSIAWLAHRLASLHDTDENKVYDCVVVITDRLVLDQQLQDTIFQIDHRQGVVQKIENDSTQLAEELVAGAAIIVSTLHKFGFITEKIGTLPDRNYAVLVDEAHSSQSGDLASRLKEALSGAYIDRALAEQIDDDDRAAPEQAALRAALTRGPQPNLSFFGFTATPKYKTLELFGHRDAEGKARPFDLYSMRQAIEEHFIHDVLKGYTTYARFFQLVKAVTDDPELDKRKASRALARYVDLHPANIVQKTKIMVDHFRDCLVDKLDGQAKAMVVTDSRLAAVRYKQAFDAHVKAQRYDDVSVLVAFTGEVRDPDDPEVVYTEPELNRNPLTGRRLPESELPAAFASAAYNVLIVAEKYQTGFNQPLLCGMYVDRRLSGIQAVQTLSRLNRHIEGKQTVVLDFVNEPEDILEAFQPYYERVATDQPIDPQRLYELQGQLDTAQVYLLPEVELYARVFFKPIGRHERSDSGRLSSALDPAHDRFRALDETDADLFRGRLQAFVNLYAFLAQIIPFSDVDLEKRYAFGRGLLHKIRHERDGVPAVDLGDDVALYYYRLEKRSEGDLALIGDVGSEVGGPGASGTAASQAAVSPLSELIRRMNERFGTDFDVQHLVDSVTEELVADDAMRNAARVNDKANFAYAFHDALDEALIARHGKNAAFIDAIFGDARMLAFFRRLMLDGVYARLGGDVAGV